MGDTKAFAGQGPADAQAGIASTAQCASDTKKARKPRLPLGLQASHAETYVTTRPSQGTGAPPCPTSSPDP